MFPEEEDGTERLWVTIEGWDGGVHQASWPLSEVDGRGVAQVRWARPQTTCSARHRMPRSIFDSIHQCPKPAARRSAGVGRRARAL